MLKRTFSIAVVLIISFMLLLACSTPAEFNPATPNDYVADKTDENKTEDNQGEEYNKTPVVLPEIESYRTRINSFLGLFEVSFGQHVNSSDTAMTRVDIKNISSKRFTDVLLNVIFSDEEGNIEKTHDAGVYSHINPQDVVSVYFKDFDEVENGYVIGYKENYFGV